ncbi:hypothetical protein IM725_08575 [Ramlibacter aquaticus]|uniref:Lipoprotein n=2 Tax=Comamonadaceae TaxID=80864 RepID=A0ABR9SE65_9BURK|nr:hypothetical protein [Ramlibacter aquaticus]
MKSLPLSVTCLALAGCVTLTGTYEVKAVDADGVQLNKLTNMAFGRSIYTVRNALCIRFPKSKVVITDWETKKELSGESPYQCA